MATAQGIAKAKKRKKRKKSGTALVPRKETAPAPPRPAKETMGLAEYGRRQRQLAEFVKTYLKKGNNAKGDYGFIVTKEGKKVSDKLVLFKSGAEKLAELYQLGVRMKCVKEEEDWGKETVTTLFMSYTYRCDVFKVENPTVIIAQCEGAANSTEPGCRDYGKPQPANSIRKRAQKRAYVGAVIMATRSSQWFTQDLEDANPDVPNVQESAKPKNRLDKEQQLHMLAEECGDTKKETEAYLKERFGSKTATKLKLIELEALVDRMKIARDIVGIAKGHGYMVEQIKKGMTMKYDFTSWLQIPMDTLRKMLVVAREAAGGAS